MQRHFLVAFVPQSLLLNAFLAETVSVKRLVFRSMTYPYLTIILMIDCFVKKQQAFL